jgi:aminopeptidase N
MAIAIKHALLSIRYALLSTRYALVLTALFSGVIFSAEAQSGNRDVKVSHYGFSIGLSDSSNRITGSAAVTVRFLRSARSLDLDLAGPGEDPGPKTDSGMTVRSVRENGKDLSFTQGGETLRIKTPASAGSSHTYVIEYAGIPRDGLIISTNKFGHRTFFGDNWPNRAHQWLPCIDYPSDKATVDFTVTAPDHYQVVSNGLEIAETPLDGHLKRTHWKETAPLPTKVMVIGVADFSIDHPGDVQTIPVYTYVFPENKEDGFRDYAIATTILPFYIRMIGPYAYEKLGNVQSKTIFGGMENASAIFYYENSVGSRGIEELMAHEIAHQWFGDAVTETGWQHLWLSEGFATYMTHLYMENKYGRDTLKSGMDADRRKVIGFGRKRQTPVVDTTVKGNYMQLLNANSYQKGGWVLHMLRRRLSDSIFWKGIRSYFAAYAGLNANTADFQKAMEKASGQDLGDFFRQWLYTPGIPVLQVSWKYDDSTKVLNMQIEQRQEHLFSFPLEYSLGKDPGVHTIAVRDRTTVIRMPLAGKPDSVKLDPDVNLLAEIHLE